ncbi:MAG: bleomycin resistance protein [Bdellovibrionia bacterium]
MSVLSPAIPQLPSGNILQTETFYIEFLGFEVVAKYPAQNFLILKRGSAELHFWQASSESEAKAIGSASSCYIRVQDIEPLFEEFKNRGAPFVYELKKQPWGMNEMQVNDPYGNAIRFGESVR